MTKSQKEKLIKEIDNGDVHVQMFHLKSGISIICMILNMHEIENGELARIKHVYRSDWVMGEEETAIRLAKLIPGSEEPENGIHFDLSENVMMMTSPGEKIAEYYFNLITAPIEPIDTTEDDVENMSPEEIFAMYDQVQNAKDKADKKKGKKPAKKWEM